MGNKNKLFDVKDIFPAYGIINITRRINNDNISNAENKYGRRACSFYCLAVGSWQMGSLLLIKEGLVSLLS